MRLWQNNYSSESVYFVQKFTISVCLIIGGINFDGQDLYILDPRYQDFTVPLAPGNWGVSEQRSWPTESCPKP